MADPRRELELLQARDRDITRRVGRVAPLLPGSLLLASASLWPLLGLRAVLVFAVLSFGFRALDPDFPPLARWAESRPGIGVAAVCLGITCVVSGGPHSPLVMLFAMPAVVACTHLRGRRLAVSLAATEASIVAVAASAGPAAIVADPHLVVVPSVTLLMVSIVVIALATSDFEHRHAAALDPLTGMLNRHGLAGRFAELSAQAERTAEPVSVALIDLDGFKSVNDEHGHARGDAVLQAVAEQVNASLRSFELAYRIGGDEFVVVLPGVALAEAVEVAERLRRRIEEARPGGLSVTLSIGVSSAAGTDLAERGYAGLYAEADAALYRSKLGGHNRVEPSPAARPPRAVAA
jgi:diguanylate cyclase (GGDEF)-like protein